MKNILLTLVLCATALTFGQAQSSPAAAITGRWLATEGVAFAPWTFDLRADGNTLTGTVSQSATDGKGWSTSLTAPVSISDGRIDGNTIAFTVLNPQASNRRIIFKGQVDNDRISFQRDVEVLGGGGLGRDGIYGGNGARQFVARRASSQPLLSSNPLNPPPLETPRVRNVSGRWVTEGVPNGPWTWNLRVSGTRLTGTVRQGVGEAGSVEIFDGAIDGPVIFFKSKSPDGNQTVAFTGLVNGDEMTVLRVVEVRNGGSPGAGGIFSVSAPSVVMARRSPGTIAGDLDVRTAGTAG